MIIFCKDLLQFLVIKTLFMKIEVLQIDYHKLFTKIAILPIEIGPF